MSLLDAAIAHAKHPKPRHRHLQRADRVSEWPMPQIDCSILR